MMVINRNNKSTISGTRKTWEKSSITLYLLYNLPDKGINDFFSSPGFSSNK
jgi:hypothetical protein